MAKKKKPKIDGDHDEPRRVGDATEFDLSLKKMDEAAARAADGDDFDLLTPAAEPVEDFAELEGPRVGDATESTYNEIDLGAVPGASASSSNLFGTKPPVATPHDSNADLELVLPAQPAASSSNLFDAKAPAASPYDSNADLELVLPAQPAASSSRLFDAKAPPPTPADSNADLGAAGSTASSSNLFGSQSPAATPADSNADLGSVPTAQPAASASNLFDSKKPVAKPGDSVADLGVLPSQPAASASSLFGSKFPAAAPPDSNADLELPAAVQHLAESSVHFGSKFAAATPADSNADLEPAVPAQPAASSSDLFGADRLPETPANLEPIAPVQPASGWFDEVDEEAPQAVSTDAIDAAMSQPASGVVDGSDIFAGPVPAALPKSDVSDVIAATAYSPAKPAEEKKQQKPVSRVSDVALNFDRPPGGSTVESASGFADLPVAEEAHDSLFGEDLQKDSSQFVKAPNLPDDAADFGATPADSIDASSILADFSSPGSSHGGDSSAIRLEEPEPTIRKGQDKPKFARESTELDMELPDAEEADSNDWQSQSGSDLLGTRPEFELTPDMGKVDPFADELDLDQPSLSTAPSSIFSGSKPVAAGSGSSVPVANPDSSADAVEFSDHPDPTAADSGSFHVMPAGGAVDFEMPGGETAHPERSMMAHIPEDDDWTNAKTDPGPGASGVNLRKRLDPTDEMTPIPATPVKGKPEKKPAAKVVPWSDDATDEELASPKRRDPKPEPSSKRGFAGLALGLVLGVGASAGAYFSGVLPNKEGGGTAQASPELQSKYDAATAELKTEREKASQWEKNAANFEAQAKAEKINAAEAEKKLTAQSAIAANLKAANDALAADIKTEKEKTLQAIKDGAADKEKVVSLGKDIEAEKAKTLKAEKDLIAEKDKVVKVEKDLVTEKDKVVKAEKDLKAEKDNTLKIEKDLTAKLDKAMTDAKKDLDAAKADLTKAQDALKTETADKTKLADAVKAKQATVDAIAKELQNGKLLGEKFDDAALLAAAKSSVSRATGPDLSKLVPPELSAIAGTGLSTGHILELASRTNKADAAVKAATGEVAKLKTDHAAEVKAMTDAAKKTVADLKDAHATELKKTVDANMLAMDKLKVDLKNAKDATVVEVKKANDAALVALDKLKVELKTAKDGTAAEVKKANDAAAVAMDKLKEELKTAKDGTAAEVKKATEAAAVAMDKLKVELKTAKDGTAAEVKKANDAAAAAMSKLKADGDAKLKEAADLHAKQTAMLEAAVTAERVKTAEAERRVRAGGGASVTQELDRAAAQAAARNRDLGIAAYKAGRFAQAIPVLEEAAKHDPNDALAWYFLGATKWAQGKTDDAKADYKKGAEREVQRLVPSREIDAMIGAIQGPARDALTAARP